MGDFSAELCWRLREESGYAFSAATKRMCPHELLECNLVLMASPQGRSRSGQFLLSTRPRPINVSSTASHHSKCNAWILAQHLQGSLGASCQSANSKLEENLCILQNCGSKGSRQTRLLTRLAADLGIHTTNQELGLSTCNLEAHMAMFSGLE